MMISFLLWALAVGVGLGLVASREWISKPLWETEAGLRKGLKEARVELLRRNCEIDDLRWDNCWRKVAHFELAERIEHRAPSDVLFIQVEDLLR